MRRQILRKKSNNKGSAFVLVLAIISFIAILGTLSLSTALLNVRMRGINRDSDKNFYYLETALDEIYAQTGRLSSEILKEQYADILGKLYQENSGVILDTNEKANEMLKTQFMKHLAEKLTISLSGTQKSNCENASEVLKGFTKTISNLTVTIDDVIFQKQHSSNGKNENVGSYSGLVLKGLCLTYVNPETNIESALTVDLRVDVPYVRFINSGSALLDYVMVANEEIAVNSGGQSQLTDTFNGNLYGGKITIDHANVTTNSSLVTSAGNLTMKNNASLSMNPDTEAQGTSRVWAQGIGVNTRSKLFSIDTGFYVQDDMTLTGGQNQVALQGSYYGYGNEGINTEIITETPSKSSAILLNDKNSRVDLTELDSLILAGRAYLRFNTNENNSNFVYPMGESLAVRATQSMYLIPERYITVKTATESRIATNPILLPDEEVTISVSIPKGVLGETVKEGTYKVTNPKETGTVALQNKPEDAAFLVRLNGKLYVYYNFASNKERSEYFEKYLNNPETAISFKNRLEKSGMTGKESGIIIGSNDSMTGRVLTSGSLYQVAGNGGDDMKLPFELLQTRQDELSSTLSWVELGKNLQLSFDNLKKNLAETMKITGKREELSTDGKSLLPMGNYVKVNELAKMTDPIYKENEDCAIRMFPGDTEVILDEDNIKNSGKHGYRGLIVSGGDVTITCKDANKEYEFNGLIIAKGSIKINGNVTLNADAGTYESLLENSDIAKYFYDYSDAPSTILNNYEDFVTKENWSRTGREQEVSGEDETQ